MLERTLSLASTSDFKASDEGMGCLVLSAWSNRERLALPKNDPVNWAKRNPSTKPKKTKPMDPALGA